MAIELARLVSRRAQRSLYLLDGLRRALEDLDRPDIAEVLELVRQDARDAYVATERFLVTTQKRHRLGILVDLHQLSRFGGPKGQRLAKRVAHGLDA